MSTIHVKPKPWKELIAEMQIKDQLQFDKLNTKSIKAMISGPIKESHPQRVYKTSTKGTAMTVTRLS